MSCIKYDYEDMQKEVAKAVHREREEIVEKLKAIFYGYDAIGAFDDAINMIRARGEGKLCGCNTVGRACTPFCNCLCHVQWAQKPEKIARLERTEIHEQSFLVDRINELIDAENARRDKDTT